MSKDLALTDQKEVMEFLTKDVDAGLDVQTSGQLPMVKITTSMSNNNILANGEASAIGKLYHTELKKDYKTINANIVYLGQYDLPDFVDKSVKKMTYVAGAVNRDDNTPFIIFIKGFSLQAVWDFLKDIGSVKTRYKIPMYPLNVTIGVKNRPHEKYKDVNVWDFQIGRDKEGVPIIEKDMGRLQFLDDSIEMFRTGIKNILSEDAEKDPYLDKVNKVDV